MKKLFSLLILMMGLTAEAAVIPTFSYSGRLLDSNDIPVNQSFLTFQVRLRKGACNFYQESIPQNLSNSGGYFTLDVGTGSAVSGQLNNLYGSGNIQDINGQNCTINADDISYINIVVSGLTGGQVVDFGWVQLKNSYQGLNSVKLGGKNATDYISVSTSVTQSNLETLLGSGILDGSGNLNVYSKTNIDSQFSGVTTSLGSYALKDFSNVTAVPAAKVTGQLALANMPDLSTTYALKSSLAAVATNGQYASLTGRPTGLSQFTNDAGYVTSFSLPNIDWSKITGRPTTVDGYGILDSIKNIGGVYSFQSGNEGSRPSSAIAGSIFIATDTQKTYYYTGSSWTQIGSAGGVSAVNATSPINTSGGTSPTISITKADATHDGYVSFNDWNTFNGKLSNSLAAGRMYVGNSGGVAVPMVISGDIAMSDTGAATLTKIQGKSVSPNAPVDHNVMKYDGANWTPSFVGLMDIRSTAIPTSNLFPTNCTSGQTMTYSSLTDMMVCTNITVDGEQIVYQNVPANYVLAAPDGATGVASFRPMTPDDLPNIPWSKLFNTPVLLSEYGITDAVQNKGNAQSIQSGLDSVKPTTEDDGAIYIATDSKKIYQQVSGAWVVVGSALGSGGTVTGLTGDVTTVGTGNLAVTVAYVGSVTAANVASGANAANNAVSTNTASTLVKRDGSGAFSAGSITATGVSLKDNGANTITLSAPTAVGAPYTLKFPSNQGSTNQVLTLIDNAGTFNWTTPVSSTVAVSSPLVNSGTATAAVLSIPQANGSTNGYLSSTDWATFNSKVTSSLASGNIFVGNGSGIATSVAMGGDISITNAGITSVSKIQGTAVSATTPTNTSQVMKFSGSNWAPGYVGIADIRSTQTGNAAFFPTGCTTGQVWQYQSPADVMACTSISITASQVSGVVDTTTTQSIAGNKTFTGNVVAKTITASTASSSTNAIDLSTGNTQISTYNCAGEIALSNMNDGGSYNVVVQDTTATTQCTFTATGVTTWKFQPANAARTASSHTVYSMLRAGSTVYVWWTSGF